MGSRYADHPAWGESVRKALDKANRTGIPHAIWHHNNNGRLSVRPEAVAGPTAGTRIIIIHPEVAR